MKTKLNKDGLVMALTLGLTAGLIVGSAYGLAYGADIGVVAGLGFGFITFLIAVFFVVGELIIDKLTEKEIKGEK